MQRELAFVTKIRNNIGKTKNPITTTAADKQEQEY
jgi:hypothetical protein